MHKLMNLAYACACSHLSAPASAAAAPVSAWTRASRTGTGWTLDTSRKQASSSANRNTKHRPASAADCPATATGPRSARDSSASNPAGPSL